MRKLFSFRVEIPITGKYTLRKVVSISTTLNLKIFEFHFRDVEQYHLLSTFKNIKIRLQNNTRYNLSFIFDIIKINLDHIVHVC